MAPGIDPFVDTRKPKNGPHPGEKVAMLAVNKQIDPRDHMFNSGPDWYWGVGENGLLAVRRVLGLTYTTSVRQILDLPSGHGRVVRYLRAGFPDAEIFFCDIDVHGAQFCAGTFRGIAIPSRPELTEVDLPRDCDVIWVGSLFTHVDRDRTKRWLAHLCSRLSARGVLVATFHGSWAIKVHEKEPMIAPEAWAAVLEGYKATGFGYAPYPDKTENYGISFTPALRNRCHDRRHSGRAPALLHRAWMGR